MTKEEFHTLLIGATFITLRACRYFVTNELPIERFEYRIASGLYLSGPENDLQVIVGCGKGQAPMGLDERGVVDLLYREGSIPRWIDISPEAVKADATLFRLDCSDRYTTETDQMYYSHRGLGPFGIKTPILPIDYKDGIKFSLPLL